MHNDDDEGDDVFPYHPLAVWDKETYITKVEVCSQKG